MIEFQDIDKVDEPVLMESPEDRPAGYVHFLPNGGWHAFRVSTGFEKSGDGSLRDLDAGLWITNLPYEKVSVIASDMRHVMLRSDGWMKATADQILGAGGMENSEPRIAARYIATIIHRVHSLALEMLRDLNPEPRHAARMRAALRTRASLASGLFLAHDPSVLKSRPSEKKTESVFSQVYQLGLYCYGRKVPPQGHLNLSFRFPSLSYGLMLSRDPVPGPSSWKIALKPEELSDFDFIEKLRDMNIPMIFRASHAKSGSMQEEIDAMTGSNRSASTYRSLFLLDEIMLLRSRVEMSLSTVIAGQNWTDTSTGKMLESLVKICGSRKVAAHSWSANILAENVLASIFRHTQSDTPSAEAIWLASRDRCMMLPVIEALYPFGASLVTAQYGVITMQCPKDPELLSGLMDAAWRAGLSLPMSDVTLVRSLGVDIPSAREDYGGNPVDYGVSLIAQTEKRRALLILDQIMDLPSRKREEQFVKILS